MTDLMLHPHGPTRTGERAARREVIDYIAASMAFQKGRSWNRMTAARQEQMRAQARAGLHALRSFIDGTGDGEAFIAVGASMSLDDGSDATTVGNHASAYIREVLK